MAKLFNPGTRIFEMLSFSHTNTDAKEGYVLSYWQVDAKPEEFFEIPDVFEMPGIGGGTVDISLKSVIDKATTQYRERGVVLVKPNQKVHGKEVDYEDDYNVAPTDAEAKRKGNRLWKEFLYGKAQEWIAICEENKGRGVPTKPASNLFKHALRVCGIPDPADTVGTITQVKADAATSNALQAEIDSLRDQLNQAIGAMNAKKAS